MATSVDDRMRDPATKVLAGGGEMGALMRATDWAQTPLGPVAEWSASLRTMVRMLLANRFPLLLWWGSEHYQLYNDPYRPVLGTKHPHSLGQRARDCWPEIWHIIGPLIQTPYTGGPPTWDDDLALEVNRHGFIEETHFTVAYSPVPDDAAVGGIGGVLATVHEITRQVIQERRVVALRDLGAHSAEAKTAEQACTIAAKAFAQHPKDVPFALLYLIDAERQVARLAGAAGVTCGEPAAPLLVDLAGGEEDWATTWPLAEVVRAEQPRLVDDLAIRFAGVPPGPWADPPARALVLPVASNIPHRPAGLLVLGLSVRLTFDELYGSFAELATAQVATAIANARAYEEERRRAEALAELDRAKTAFFSNVSHEFRTPLTLLLGPLEEVLAAGPSTLLETERTKLESAHRNSLRLLRLVNTLLDFARIEAGRIEASYEPLDLAALTIDLAGMFRAAIERAGLRLEVDCPPLSESIYVDRDMWEKIVLNLLSNAFKFTFAGQITVSLRPAGDQVELRVSDSGVGIPANELPHIFERFYRVRGVSARTHEGTGIGLALTRELIALHGGSIEVESLVDSGTTFTVTVPSGAAHLPAARIGAARTRDSTALGATPYVEEALRWLPEPPAAPAIVDSTVRPSNGGVTEAAQIERVLIADDNADMRAYLQRLLGPRYAVVAMSDGAAALEAARTLPPDLVLADVMMPGLDGFALLHKLRADPRTREVPIILLSARAGEEARVEGLEAGADDYVVKPFAANELLARVETHLAAARSGRQAQVERDRLRQILDVLPVGVSIAGADGRVEMLNQAGQKMVGVDTLGRSVLLAGGEAYTEYGVRRPDDTPYPAEDLPLSRSLRHGEVVENDYEILRHAETGRDIPLVVHSAPLRDPAGAVIGAVAVFQDITAIRAMERTREEFLSSAVHDLKTPLTSIRGYAQLIQRRLARLDTAALDAARVIEPLARIQEGTGEMLSLINELADMAQLEMGAELILQRRPTDLVALVRDGIAAQQVASGARIDLEAPLPEVVAMVDAGRIERVVGNLLSNAIKFSPNGGRIAVRVAQDDEDGSLAAITVKDEGIGIPALDLPHIFDRFARGGNVVGHIQGTGIGLASARGIVERHGGTITAESVEGRSATFTVRLPLI